MVGEIRPSDTIYVGHHQYLRGKGHMTNTAMLARAVLSCHDGLVAKMVASSIPA